MSYRSMKNIRNDAEKLLDEAVGNREQLFAAVPVLVELQRAIESAKKNIDDCRSIAAALSDACAKYAIDKPDYVFSDSVSYAPNGVMSGDVTIDGKMYHFYAGHDGFVRDEAGQKITQQFLEGLPKGWVKSKLELSTSGINAEKPDDGKLSVYGLARKPKYSWGVVV